MLIIATGYDGFSMTVKTDKKIKSWDGAMEHLTNECQMDNLGNCFETVTKMYLVSDNLDVKTVHIYDAKKKKVEKIDFSLWEKEQLEWADTERDPSTLRTCALIDNKTCTATNADKNTCLNPDEYDSACTFCQSYWRAQASNDDAPITLRSER